MKIEMIEIGKLKPDPNNPRKGDFDKDELNGMAETIKIHGVIEPIEIDEKNQITLGDLRWRASKIAGLEKIPCIRKTGLSKEEKLERQLIENIQRQPIDLGRCVDELKRLMGTHEPSKFANKDKQNAVGLLSKRLGINDGWLRDILKIADAPEPIKKEVEKYYKSDKKQGISASQAIEIIKAPEEIQSRLLKKAKEGIPHKRLREEVHSHNETKEFLDRIKLSETDKKTPEDYVSEINKRFLDILYFLPEKDLEKIAERLNSDLKKRLSRMMKDVKNRLELVLSMIEE